ncbi:hypothetical protein [Azorhizobium sp. AG788]|uniref:hypothetical protein n=1 Tax=Azorhizobium sp. AG788 TaxID=2183897 RepID=UPI003138F86F
MTPFLRRALSPRNRSTKLFTIAAGFVVVAGGLFHAARSNNTYPPVLLSPQGVSSTGSPLETADLEHLVDGTDGPLAPRTIPLTPPLPHPRPAAGTAKPPKPTEREARDSRKDKVAGDRCATGCATRDPLIRAPLTPRTTLAPVPASAMPARFPARAVAAARPSGPPEISPGEAMLVSGRDMFAWIVAAPGTTINIGKGAISQVANAIR